MEEIYAEASESPLRHMDLSLKDARRAIRYMHEAIEQEKEKANDRSYKLDDIAHELTPEEWDMYPLFRNRDIPRRNMLYLVKIPQFCEEIRELRVDAPIDTLDIQRVARRIYEEMMEHPEQYPGVERHILAHILRSLRDKCYKKNIESTGVDLKKVKDIAFLFDLCGIPRNDLITWLICSEFAQRIRMLRAQGVWLDRRCVLSVMEEIYQQAHDELFVYTDLHLKDAKKTINLLRKAMGEEAGQMNAEKAMDELMTV